MNLAISSAAFPAISVRGVLACRGTQRNELIKSYVNLWNRRYSSVFLVNCLQISTLSQDLRDNEGY